MNGNRLGFLWSVASTAALLFSLTLSVSAYESEEPRKIPQPSAPVTTAAKPREDIEEKLGALIPAELTFLDTDGKGCDLRACLTKPTILALVYYGCTGECNLILDSLTEVLPKIPQKPGTDFQVVSVSFDATEDQPMASRKRDNVLNILGPAFPRDAWRFLVGDSRNIDALTAAVGFHFFRKEEVLIHSTALIFLAPGGKIVRYLHGTEYLPAEVSLALSEAEAGKTGVSARKMLSYCFSYDPANRRYTTTLLRGIGIAVFLGLGLLFWLMLRPRKNRQQPPKEGPGNA